MANLGKKVPYTQAAPLNLEGFFNCNSLKVEPWVGGPKFGLETSTTKVKLEDSGYQTHQARRDARLKIETEDSKVGSQYETIMQPRNLTNRYQWSKNDGRWKVYLRYGHVRLFLG